MNAESLDVGCLATSAGVEHLKDWVRQHYLDVEVTLVGRSLSDLFRKLKRKPQQTFRDYAAEFNRLLARVTECGCRLPDVANAWLFVDRANLDEQTEVSLLASVGNRYELKALQQAAIILDRSMRKPWEKPRHFENRDPRRAQTVHQTEEYGRDDEGHSSEDEPPSIDDPDIDGEALYVSYMTAKARYKEVTKSRGVVTTGDPPAAKKAAEEMIRLAKSRSHCSACGQKGHWHRDSVCPKHKDVTRPGPRPSTSRMTSWNSSTGTTWTSSPSLIRPVRSRWLGRHGFSATSTTSRARDGTLISSTRKKPSSSGRPAGSTSPPMRR